MNTRVVYSIYSTINATNYVIQLFVSLLMPMHTQLRICVCLCVLMPQRNVSCQGWLTFQRAAVDAENARVNIMQLSESHGDASLSELSQTSCRLPSASPSFFSLRWTSPNPSNLDSEAPIPLADIESEVDIPSTGAKHHHSIILSSDNDSEEQERPENAPKKKRKNRRTQQRKTVSVKLIA